MMEAASFPHLGRVVNPTREHYEAEAVLSREAARCLRNQKGRYWVKERPALAYEKRATDYERIARRLAWVPAALQQMQDAA